MLVCTVQALVKTGSTLKVGEGMTIRIQSVNIQFLDLSDIDPDVDRLKVTLESGAILYFVQSNLALSDLLSLDFETSDEGVATRLTKRLWDNRGRNGPSRKRLQETRSALIGAWTPDAFTNRGYLGPLLLGGGLTVLAGPDQWGSSEYTIGKIGKIEVSSESSRPTRNDSIRKALATDTFPGEGSETPVTRPPGDPDEVSISW